MIRYLFVLPLFFSCASLDYQEIYQFTKSNLIGVSDIEINEDLIKKTKYSFIKVKIGKSKVAILPLSEIENDVYTWVGSDAVIFTKNGRIIKTIGLQYNLSMINKNNDEIFVNLHDPDAIISQKLELSSQDLVISGKNNYEEIKETFTTDQFKWSGVNTFIRDKKSGLVFKSTQEIHPRLNIISLDFVYVY